MAIPSIQNVKPKEIKLRRFKSNHLYYKNPDKAQYGVSIIMFVLVILLFAISSITVMTDPGISAALCLIGIIGIIFSLYIYPMLHSSRKKKKIKSQGTVYKATVIDHHKAIEKGKVDTIYKTDQEIFSCKIDGVVDELWLPLNKEKWHRVSENVDVVVWNKYFMLNDENNT